MSFYKVNTEEAAKVEGGGSNYITQSGIFDITLNALIVDLNEKGARTLNPFLSINDQGQVIYGGIRLDNNDGSRNFQAGVFDKLCVVCGVEDIEDPVEATLPIGKAGADKEVAVLPDFEEIPLKIRVQMEYSIPTMGAKAGKIRESKVIKNFYREDGAEASEILSNSEVGVKLAKDMAYADNITYKDSAKGANDAPTPELIQAWIAAKRPDILASAIQTEGGEASSGAAPKASFGRKFGANKKD